MKICKTLLLFKQKHKIKCNKVRCHLRINDSDKTVNCYCELSSTIHQRWPAVNIIQNVVSSWRRWSPVLVRITQLTYAAAAPAASRHNGSDTRHEHVMLAPLVAKPTSYTLFPCHPHLPVFYSTHNEVRWQHGNNLWWGVIAFLLFPDHFLLREGAIK